MIFDEILHFIVPPITSILEIIGVLIIAVGSAKSLFLLVKDGFRFDDEELKLQLAQALALSLEFKLGAEILKTVLVRTTDEFIVLAAIVILRVILTVVIHWEIRSSNEDRKKEEQELRIKTLSNYIEKTEKQENGRGEK